MKTSLQTTLSQILTILLALPSAILLLSMHIFPRVTNHFLNLVDWLRHQTPVSLLTMVLSWIVLLGLGLPLCVLYLGLRWWFPRLEGWVCGVIGGLWSSEDMRMGGMVKGKGKNGNEKGSQGVSARRPLTPVPRALDEDMNRNKRTSWRALIRAWPWSEAARNGLVTVPQRGSLFFDRLPLDVRHMIYREVLGDSTVHVFLHGRRQLCEPELGLGGWGRKKLWYFRCERKQDDGGDGVRCWSKHRTWVHGIWCAGAGEDGFPRERPLSLLMSCRRA